MRKKTQYEDIEEDKEGDIYMEILKKMRKVMHVEEDMEEAIYTEEDCAQQVCWGAQSAAERTQTGPGGLLALGHDGRQRGEDVLRERLGARDIYKS